MKGKTNSPSSSSSHPGFDTIQTRIAAKSGVSMKRAGAILASKTRSASSAARGKNTKLKRVKG